MQKIGYVRLRDATAPEDIARLKAVGCHVIRAEASGEEDQTLASILHVMGPGDELVVVCLERLATSGHAILDTLDRLEASRASLVVLRPSLSSAGVGGVALRAALQAVSDLEPFATQRRRRPAVPPAQEIVALQQAGVGPVEIARRLGVSRMTVWRKLKAVEGAEA